MEIIVDIYFYRSRGSIERLKCLLNIKDLISKVIKNFNDHIIV